MLENCIFLKTLECNTYATQNIFYHILLKLKWSLLFIYAPRGQVKYIANSFLYYMKLIPIVFFELQVG